MKKSLFRRAADDLSRCSGLLPFLYITGLAWGIISAIPAGRASIAGLGQSLAGDIISRKLDLLLISEVVHSHQKLFDEAGTYLIIMLAIGSLIRVFFTGGVLDLISVPNSFDSKRFFSRSIRLFPRLLALFILQVLALASLVAIWQGNIPELLFTRSFTERPLFIAELTLGIVLAAICYIMTLILKYVRIFLVERTQCDIGSALSYGFSFFTNNTFAIFAISLYTPGVLVIGISAKWVWTALFHSLDFLRFPTAILTTQLLILLYQHLRNLSLAASIRLVRERTTAQKILADTPNDMPITL